MKGSLLGVATATAAVFVNTASALTYEKRDNPRVVHMKTERGQASPATLERMRFRRRGGRLAKKDGKTVGSQIDNIESGSLYFVNTTLGTPGQKLRFHVDTGSSDLWTNVPNSTVCQMPDEEIEQTGNLPCDVSGTFDSSQSSSFKVLNNQFYIQYADTTGASGDYATDDLSIGGVTLNAQQFGLGLESNSTEGVMGIGYPSLEVAVQNGGGGAYPNVPQMMVQQGYINTPSYSLWLDDINSATGNILFGGVDTSKFTGSLVTVPIVPESGQYIAMVVGLSGISVNSNGKETQVDTQAIPVLLDSGSTLMYLPTEVAQSIYNAVGATYSEESGAIVKCSLGQNTAETLDFNFSGQTIKVPMSQLVINEGSQEKCLFGIMPTPDSSAPFTLGDSFIRAAYLVYDLSANTISIAQSNFDAGDSNVQEITNGTTGVPAASPATSTAAVVLNGAGANGFNGGVPTNAANLANAAPIQTPAPAVKALGAIAAGAGVLMAL